MASSLPFDYCPYCASPETFVIKEKCTSGELQVLRECVCGETWWSNVPAALTDERAVL